MNMAKTVITDLWSGAITVTQQINCKHQAPAERVNTVAMRLAGMNSVQTPRIQFKFFMFFGTSSEYLDKFSR